MDVAFGACGPVQYKDTSKPVLYLVLLIIDDFVWVGLIEFDIDQTESGIPRQ